MKVIKEKYISMDILKAQSYIKFIKDTFERELGKKLSLTRISAPIVVTRDSGLQDDLSGVERTVPFDIRKDGQELEIVQSLAKWKRFALAKYGFKAHQGLYTDMTAIRRDDKVDQTHSIYVDQWDWEKVITREDRTIPYLKSVVRKIVSAISSTSKKLQKFSALDLPYIEPKVYFISAQDLLDMYPDKTDKEREYLITKKYKTVFIIGIGDKLSDGKPHDLRAPDYDDWSLDGDLLFFDDVIDCALEISSMGVRVDAKKMEEQLIKSSKTDRLQLKYHQDIIHDKLPLTIGGGIGQSRLCMLLLGRAHIGEVQSSYWDKETISQCTTHKITLL